MLHACGLVAGLVVDWFAGALFRSLPGKWGCWFESCLLADCLLAAAPESDYKCTFIVWTSSTARVGW